MIFWRFSICVFYRSCKPFGKPIIRRKNEVSWAPSYGGPCIGPQNYQIFYFTQNPMKIVSNCCRGHPDSRAVQISKIGCKLRALEPPKDPYFSCKLLIFDIFCNFGRRFWPVNIPYPIFIVRIYSN